MQSDYYKTCPALDRCNELIEKYWESGQPGTVTGMRSTICRAFMRRALVLRLTRRRQRTGAGRRWRRTSVRPY